MSDKKVESLDNKALNAALPKEVAEKFEILMDRRTSTSFVCKEGKFDLTKLTIAQCNALVAQKAKWIKEKTSTDSKKADGATKA